MICRYFNRSDVWGGTAVGPNIGIMALSANLSVLAEVTLVFALGKCKTSYGDIAGWVVFWDWALKAGWASFGTLGVFSCQVDESVSMRRRIASAGRGKGRGWVGGGGGGARWCFVLLRNWCGVGDR